MRFQLSRLSITRLLSLIAAFAMVLAPLSIAEASAAVPDQAQMMHDMGCHDPAGSSKHQDKMAGKICCASTGLAVAINSTMASSHDVVQRTGFARSHADWRLGFLGEIATPPPRTA